MAASGLTETNETLQRLGENLVFFLSEEKGLKEISKKPRISYSSSNVKDIERELCGVGIYPVLRI